MRAGGGVRLIGASTFRLLALQAHVSSRFPRMNQERLYRSHRQASYRRSLMRDDYNRKRQQFFVLVTVAIRPKKNLVFGLNLG